MLVVPWDRVAPDKTLTETFSPVLYLGSFASGVSAMAGSSGWCIASHGDMRHAILEVMMLSEAVGRYKPHETFATRHDAEARLRVIKESRRNPTGTEYDVFSAIEPAVDLWEQGKRMYLPDDPA